MGRLHLWYRLSAGVPVSPDAAGARQSMQMQALARCRSASPSAPLDTLRVIQSSWFLEAHYQLVTARFKGCRIRR